MKLELFTSSQKLWKCILTTVTTPGKPGSYSFWQVLWKKKVKWPARFSPGPVCTAQDKLCQTSHGAPPDPMWLWAGRVVSIPKPAQLGAADALQGFSRRGVIPCRGDSSSFQQQLQLRSHCCLPPAAVGTQLTKGRSRICAQLSLSLRGFWQHYLCRYTWWHWAATRQHGERRNVVLQGAKLLHKKWTY